MAQTLLTQTEVRAFQLTPALRWLHVKHPWSYTLEQAWQCVETGEIDWRPVPEVDNPKTNPYEP